MFEIGDYVVNATNGICQIKEVVKMDLSGGKQEKEYFYLEPVDEKSAKAYIPLDIAPTRIRKVIDAKKATEVISAVDSIEELLVSSEREREAIYKAAIKSCEPKELVAMIKNIFRRKTEVEFRLLDILTPERFEGMNTQQIGEIVHKQMEDALKEMRK